MPASFTFSPIALVRSPYRDKFAVPRQPGLVPAGTGEVILLGDCNREETLRGLDGFSHLWLTFVFDRVIGQGWKPMVRPPRLGGNRRQGVFATRSPFRPNPIGLSVVSLLGIEHRAGQWLLKVGGIDLVDNTPILDIKPYLPWVDAVAEARGGFAEEAPHQSVKVAFSDACRAQLVSLRADYPALEELIRQIIAQQPQPAYHPRKESDRDYGMALYTFNIRWRASGRHCLVYAIDPLEPRHGQGSRPLA